MSSDLCKAEGAGYLAQRSIDLLNFVNEWSVS